MRELIEKKTEFQIILLPIYIQKKKILFRALNFNAVDCQYCAR